MLVQRKMPLFYILCIHKTDHWMIHLCCSLEDFPLKLHRQKWILHRSEFDWWCHKNSNKCVVELLDKQFLDFLELVQVGATEELGIFLLVLLLWSTFLCNRPIPLMENRNLLNKNFHAQQLRLHLDDFKTEITIGRCNHFTIIWSIPIRSHTSHESKIGSTVKHVQIHRCIVS